MSQGSTQDTQKPIKLYLNSPSEYPILKLTRRKRARSSSYVKDAIHHKDVICLADVFFIITMRFKARFRSEIRSKLIPPIKMKKDRSRNIERFIHDCRKIPTTQKAVTSIGFMRLDKAHSYSSAEERCKKFTLCKQIGEKKRIYDITKSYSQEDEIGEV